MTKDSSTKPQPVTPGVRERMLKFASSEMFRKLFADGMGLVEETASYLDGEGRDASRQLSREASLSYATVSMEMTTRLMQAASWLVVQRAVQEGDMTVEEASEARFRLEDSSINAFTARQNPELPAELLELVDRGLPNKHAYFTAQRGKGQHSPGGRGVRLAMSLSWTKGDSWQLDDKKGQGSRLPALGSARLSVSLQHLGKRPWREVQVPLD